LRSSDSVGVPTNSLFPFLDVDLSGLDAHHPICPGGSHCRGLLLERLSLLLQQRLFGLEGALPRTTFLRPLRLLLAESSRFAVEIFREVGENDLSRFEDRKSTRLNSSHGSISYAVFCL